MDKKAKQNSQEYLDHLRHSCAHLLAAAIQELYPDSKRTIGPSIENGFYFDFDFVNAKISENDFSKIEKKMHEIIKTWKNFTKIDVSKDEALKEYKNNEYKVELIQEFSKEGQKLTFYKSGDYQDLCRGGHVENPNQELKYFKLLSIAGAYWKGSEKNKMLTRIYGTAFPSQKELDEYIKMLEEAEKRNHKKIGAELELFMFHETAPGMAYWLPKGLVLYNELINFWRIEHVKRNYLEIMSPIANKKQLYITSGHFDHYWEDMFHFETKEGEEYALKAMNCPNAMIVFGSKTRSYRDLPFRLSDTDILHRNELSGTLNGLLRAREFRQDDAHIFVAKDQIKEEFKNLFEITEKFYSIFGLEYRFRLGTMPESHIGEVDMWEKAVNELKGILEESKKDYFILEGDGAFYGPKIDILMKDSLGREWQMGTLQLDFQQPLRFKLKFTNKNGVDETPIAIHRVIYGSLERFIGLITEHFAGAFPLWLSPIQVKILPITERNIEYAAKIMNTLKEQNIRVEIDSDNETLGNKIRKAQNEKVNYMVIIGDKEEKDEKVAVRTREGKDLGQIDLIEFVKQIRSKIETKAIA